VRMYSKHLKGCYVLPPKKLHGNRGYHVMRNLVMYTSHIILAR